MADYELKDGSRTRIEPYENRHADSIANDLFGGMSAEEVRQGRDGLIAPGPEEVLSVCALSGSKVVGVCTGVRKRWMGERHRIEMVQVAVAEDFQRLGIARLMMKAIAMHFVERGIEMVQVSTEGSNEKAIASYERIGFREFGVLKRGLKHGNRYADEVMMWMKIEDLLG
ncbi:MAG: GNAT family N-acetyltransferase [Candidatus Thorarchaeota archaeon]|nr:GNAT family N-acetyltransferase [Candidatus Thorarchaeota archaeon]